MSTTPAENPSLFYTIRREPLGPGPTSPSIPEDRRSGHVSCRCTPITTTSPPPDGSRADFPSLMSIHQLQQGYAPSLNSMFTSSPRSKLSVKPSLFSWDMPLKEPRANVTNRSYDLDPLLIPPISYLENKTSSAPRPPLERISNERYLKPMPGLHGMRTLLLPNETFSKFLRIAEPNTLVGRETHGLLLGEEVWLDGKGLPSSVLDHVSEGNSWWAPSVGPPEERNNLVVTTLLVLRDADHTSLIDEEELVWHLTEEKGLIPLGWIHTHPSQSCFLSSADLHIQANLQRSLPEVVAVVCAPESMPNCGIFRLTDPPGLQTVLSCSGTEPPHPHPDLPIYTDADNGHARIRDLPLNVIDLRGRHPSPWFWPSKMV